MRKLIIILASLVISSWQVVAAQEQPESLSLNPATGDYLLRYRGLGDDMVEIIFIPSTKIDPTVRSHIQMERGGKVIYRYRVRNGMKALQPLVGITVLATGPSKAEQLPTKGWDDVQAPAADNTDTLVSWGYVSDRTENSTKKARGLVAGSLVEVGIISNDLPAVGIMSMFGEVNVVEFPDEGPDPDSQVGKEFNKLQKNDFVLRHVAAPRLPNPEPFNAETVLEGLRKHITTELVEMKQVMPDFAASLDKPLQLAVEAAKRGNTDSLRVALRDTRHLLRKFGVEHDDRPEMAKEKGDDIAAHDDEIESRKWPHPISRLAIRVIDFDIRYIERRLGFEKKEDRE